MNTLSEKSLKNLKIIKNLGVEEVLSSSSSRELSIQEEFVDVDNLENLENTLYFTFHQCLSDMVSMSFIEKDIIISDIEECIQNIYDNKILNGIMTDQTELYKIMDDIDIKHDLLKESYYYGSPFYNYYGKFCMLRDYITDIVNNPPCYILSRYIKEYKEFNHHLKPINLSDDESSDGDHSENKEE
tara:strand:- start:1040 stop:1597 length:558 start_codon:yes stop_codon:yes gene_type:complete